MHSGVFVVIYYLVPLICLTMSVAINFNAIQQVRMNKCIVNSYKNFIRQYVTYLVKNASKFKNFVVDVISEY